MRFSIIASFLFFCILASSAVAQNFQPFRNKFKYQYSYTGTISASGPQSGLIHGLQVDSAKLIGPDSIFYFNRLTGYSNTDFKDNFWGNSMVKKPNDDYLFLITNNTQNDTVIVKTQLALGSQWTFTLKNVLYTVKYDHYNPETVLTNQTDFVQTYIVENNSGFKDSIKISEKFGLVYSFPFSDDFIYKHNYFNLTYIFNSKTGENKIDYFEYFNYDAGDILIYTSTNIGPPTLLNNDVYKILSKTVSSEGDSITYYFSKYHINAISAGTYSTTQNHGKIVVTDWSVTGDFPYIDPLSFPAKSGHFAYTLNPYNIDGMMYGPAFGFESFATYTFQKGLGLQRYYFNGAPNYNDVLYLNTQYIKQSNIDDNFDAIETILDTKSLHASSSNLIVSPNPFDQTISINATDLRQGNWTLRITSALGVEVYTSKMVISSSDQKIDLSNLPVLTSGIYFLSLENESQVYSQKIVKQ